MFAGKTREFIGRIHAMLEQGHMVRVVKPRIDNRYALYEVVSHDGMRFPAQVVDLDASPFPTDCDVIAIDEAQFLSTKGVEKVLAALDSGISILVAGLDLDCWGRPFAAMTAYGAVAKNVKTLKGRCAVCGKPSTRSFRLIESTETVLVGGPEAYEPRCLDCFEEGHRRHRERPEDHVSLD